MSLANISTIETRVERVVDRFVNKDKMFTLLDVSEAVKAGGGPWVSHSSMKPIIEQVLLLAFSTQRRMSYYTESLITVKSPMGKLSARLYHPVGTDPDSYTNRQQQASKPKASKPKKQESLPSYHPNRTGRKVIEGRKQQVSGSGYLEVPRCIWEKAGFVPGNKVVLTVHEKSVTILLNAPKSKYKGQCERLIKETSKMKAAWVPYAGRFRVDPVTLKRAGLAGRLISFAAYTNKIVVYVKP